MMGRAGQSCRGQQVLQRLETVRGCYTIHVCRDKERRRCYWSLWVGVIHSCLFSGSRGREGIASAGDSIQDSAEILWLLLSSLQSHQCSCWSNPTGSQLRREHGNEPARVSPSALQSQGEGWEEFKNKMSRAQHQEPHLQPLPKVLKQFQHSDYVHISSCVFANLT